jgi:hypothetical protein
MLAAGQVIICWFDGIAEFTARPCPFLGGCPIGKWECITGNGAFDRGLIGLAVCKYIIGRIGFIGIGIGHIGKVIPAGMFPVPVTG